MPTPFYVARKNCFICDGTGLEWLEHGQYYDRCSCLEEARILSNGIYSRCRDCWGWGKTSKLGAHVMTWDPHAPKCTTCSGSGYVRAG